jgi:hypothetical protein
MDTTSIILKTDTRGRVCTPRQKREELLAEFERSGLSGAKFAALAGVRYTTFAGWVQQRRKARVGTPCNGSAAAQQVRLVKVVSGTPVVKGVAASQAAPPLRVLLAGGAVIEVADVAQAGVAAQLLKALA